MEDGAQQRGTYVYVGSWFLQQIFENELAS